MSKHIDKYVTSPDEQQVQACVLPASMSKPVDVRTLCGMS